MQKVRNSTRLRSSQTLSQHERAATTGDVHIAVMHSMCTHRASPSTGIPHRFTEPEYQHTTDSTTEEMAANFTDVVERLVRPLLRGLAVSNSYPPYSDPRANLAHVQDV